MRKVGGVEKWYSQDPYPKRASSKQEDHHS